MLSGITSALRQKNQTFKLAAATNRAFFNLQKPQQTNTKPWMLHSMLSQAFASKFYFPLSGSVRSPTR